MTASRQERSPERGQDRSDEPADVLSRYRSKRRFERTPEPGGGPPAAQGNVFVVQKHAARRLHYDLRLQFGDVLKSWAVTKGPSLDPADRRLAVHVEDHPLDYAGFEGTIPKGEYGGGAVIVWDHGTWVPVGDPEQGYAKGHLKFRLLGEKLHGGWHLARMKSRRDERGDNWLLIKERDTYARPGEGAALLEEAPHSVLSGETVDALAAQAASDQAASDSASATETAAEATPKRRRRRVPKPGTVAGAERGELPGFVAPQLATRVTKAPDGERWLNEIKFDGYRTLVGIDGKEVRLWTRKGLDWTRRYRALADAFAAVGCKQALIDGEIVVQDEVGLSSFSALQDALSRGESHRLVFYAFDLLYLDGFDLRNALLSERKALLAALMEHVTHEHSPLQVSEHIVGNGPAFFAEACRRSLEGIVCKSVDAPYRSGRSPLWLKVKCENRDDFLVVGFTESKAAGGLAALLLAEERADGTLGYVGRCGTGFTADQAEELRGRLRPLARDKPALAIPAGTSVRAVTWTEPALAVEVTYSTRTADGNLRAASYQGMRPDKSAAAGLASNAADAAANKQQDSTEETEDTGKATASLGASVSAPGEQPAPPAGPRRRYITDTDLAAIYVTNPGREMFGKGGPTKLDLAAYYAAVGDWMLPELLDRPVSLVRCPQGEKGGCFFQRHAGQGMPKELRRVPLREESTSKRADYIAIDDARGFLALAQFGTVEFHLWGCRVDKPERPDRMIFDLDPDEGFRWDAVVEAAVDIRDRLTELGLVAYVKTTGGKGLHLVVPLQRRQTWAGIFRFSEAFVAGLARAEPDRFTANMAKARRRDRIFVDFHRNRRSATAVAAYSLRARPGVPVSVPLSWQELSELDDPTALNWATVPRWLRQRPDPWQEMDRDARTLTRDMAREVGVKEKEQRRT